MLSDGSAALIIALMACAVFATRIAGPILMARVRPSPTIERFVEGLSVSVIAALVVSLVLSADLINAAAVAVAMVTAWATRSVLLAMAAGAVFVTLLGLFTTHL